MPVSVSDLQAHPVAYLAPQIASMFVESIETGILLKQSFSFWERAEHERVVVRLLVAFVSIVAFFQTGLSFLSVWQIYVLHFGDWIASVNFTWCDRLQSLLTMFMGAPVQAFLIWRCWTLTNRRWSVLVFLSLILLASIISSIIVTVETFQIQFTVLTAATPVPALPLNVEFILSLTSSAVLDVAVTGILLIYLARSRPSVISSRFRMIMRRLTILVWEAAVPPCACAIVTTVTYATLVNYNYWDLAFQAVLGKLYVISLFVTLNGRAELANAPTVAPGTNPRMISMLLTASALIRLDISRDPEAAHPPSLSSNGQNGDLVNLENGPDCIERDKTG